MAQESLPLLSIHEGNQSLQPLIAHFVVSIKDRMAPKELGTGL